MEYTNLIEVDRRDDTWQVRCRFVDDSVGELLITMRLPVSDRAPTAREVERHCIQAARQWLAELNRKSDLRDAATGGWSP